jgi:hypothetical protein
MQTCEYEIAIHTFVEHSLPDPNSKISILMLEIIAQDQEKRSVSELVLKFGNLPIRLLL